MKHKLFFLWILAAVLLLAACSPAETSAPESPSDAPAVSDDSTAVEEPADSTADASTTSESLTLTDGRGTGITLAGPAERIVSLAPSNTEILFAVGAGDQVVGRDAFSDYPEAAQSVTDIGGGWGEIDTETLLTLNPDLVLSADIIAPEQNAALEDLGLTVYVLPNPLSFEDLYSNLETVGELTGHPDEAAALIEDLRGRVESVTSVVSGLESRPLVFYQLDSSEPSAPWTAGPGTFIDTLITMAGGQNVGAVLEGAWAQISAEELINRNPDVILMGDAIWSGITAEDVAARPGWDAIAAVQEGQVYAFDDNLVSRPGPRLVDGLETMAALLHPESFE